MTRNRLLAIAAGVGVVAALVLVAGRAVDLSHVVSSEFPTQNAIHIDGYDKEYGRNDPYVYYDNEPNEPDIYDTVDAALNLVGAIFLVVAFGAVAIAFVRASQFRRRRLLAASALWFALYGAAIFPVPFVSTRFGAEWLITASYAFTAASSFALVVAAALTRIALLSGLPSRRAAREIKVVELSPVSSHRLAWGAVGLALYFALDSVRGAFDLDWLRNVRELPDSLIAGVALHATGYAVAAVCAAQTAAVLFGWWGRRAAILRTAAIGVGLGFLVAGSGLILEARDYQGTGVWLEAVSSLVLAVAAGCVATAFSASESATPAFA